MVVNNKILISSILFLQEPKKMRKKRKGLKPRELKNEANIKTPQNFGLLDDHLKIPPKA